jgi:transposase
MIDTAQEAPNTVFLAEDEAGLYLQATNSYVFAPVGQTPIVRVDAGRTQTHFYGTLNLLTGQEIILRSEIMNAEVSAQYLQMLLNAVPTLPILLFWDRAPWHRGKPIEKLLSENPRLQLISFPAATPDLNPQEHVWKATRKAVSHNHIEPRFAELANRFEEHLESTAFHSSFLDRYGYTAICPMFI